MPHTQGLSLAASPCCSADPPALPTERPDSPLPPEIPVRKRAARPTNSVCNAAPQPQAVGDPLTLLPSQNPSVTHLLTRLQETSPPTSHCLTF